MNGGDETWFLGKEINGENGRDKRKVLGREKWTFDTLEDLGEARERKTREKKKRKEKKREQNPSQNNITLTKEGKSCIPKSSHYQITSEGPVRSLPSVFNK